VPAKPHLRAARVAVVSLSAVLALTVVAVMALSRADAAAKQLSCGDTITADTTLDSDLVDCPNNAIVIGADGITLDLNGHLVDGDGTEFAGCDPNAEVCDSGIVDDGHDGVTVEHGRVREFGVGVLVGTSSAGKVRHNRLLDISSSKNDFFGIVVASSERSVVRNGSFGRNAGQEGDGLGVFGSDHIRIVGNSFSHNGHLGFLTGDSNNNRIKGNLFSRNDDEAILMEAGERNEITGNDFVQNGAGITLGPGSENVIAHNHVAGGRDGIRIEDGHGNVVADNVVVDAGQAGITLGIRNPLIGGDNNLVRANVVRDSRKDGFVVVKKDHHSRLKHNVAKGAGDDGFDVQSRTTKLTKNRALRNADLGIEAVQGVNDGGGNRASGNGDARQCVNVKCR
jgi:parallel beta-helix repeat protein